MRVADCCGKRALTIAGTFCVLGVLAAVLLLLRDAGARPPLGRSWPASQWLSMDDINHSRFDALLKQYVDADGFVDYAAWKSSLADRTALQAYLAELSRAAPSRPARREATLAYWINAYNAVTLEGILQVYPTTSIRNHTAKVAGYNIWKDLPLRVDGQDYSLDEMEHSILRKLDEPRIHFAIVCASVGCPRLRREAYTAGKLDQQLDDNARDFFSRPQNLRADASRRTLYLSSILDWFGRDFGRTQAEQLTRISQWLPESARALAADPQVRVRFLDYNWDLNDQKTRRQVEP